MTSSWTLNDKLGWEKNLIKKTFGDHQINSDTIVWMKKYRTEIAASSASLTSTLVAYPLDSVKTRIQAFPAKNVFDCVQQTFKQEGYHGFMRGVTAPLASITLVRTMSFSIYQKSKYFFDSWIFWATGKSPLVHANTRGASPSLSTVACFGAAGAVSGALITGISCPFELTKLNAQVEVLIQNEKNAKGKSGTMTKLPLVKSPFARVADLFKATHVKEPAISNTTKSKTGQGDVTKPEAIKSKPTEPTKPDLSKIKPEPFKASHIAAETIKSGPVKTLGTWGTVKMIYQYRGFVGLYSGFQLHLLRDTIGTAIYFGIYESAKQILANARGNNPTSPLAVVVAGGLCGIASWAFIYPIDTAKSIYQRSVLSTPGGIADVPKINFFKKASYRGLSVSMIRSCLINAIFFSVFEATKKGINKLKSDEE